LEGISDSGIKSSKENGAVLVFGRKILAALSAAMLEARARMAQSR